MTDANHMGSDDEVLLGAAIRELRVQKGMTIEELAEASQLSTGLISKIERDLGNPSISSLRRISKALGVPTAFFFAREPGAHNEQVSHNNKRVYAYPRSRVSYTAIVSPVSDDVEFFMIEAMPGARGGTEAVCHQGFEQGMVVEGCLEVTVGDRVFNLGLLDTISFPSAIPHMWANKGPERCRSIWAIATKHPLAMFDSDSAGGPGGPGSAGTEADTQVAILKHLTESERNGS
ncbi:MAG: helix-turn-helix domain-containing protein [Clostridia bacterium]|nr:helix-turn-helix domain-containing protein [Clostridia bacterium]